MPETDGQRQIDEWARAEEQNASEATVLADALERARGMRAEDIDPQYHHCPLCRAATGERMTLIDTIARIADLCPPCSEDVAGDDEQRILREIGATR